LNINKDYDDIVDENIEENKEIIESNQLSRLNTKIIEILNNYE